MSLRPINFNIPSTTELKVIFSEKLSPLLSISNIAVVSLNGAVDDLSVYKIEITDNELLIKTSPQVEGNYYTLKLLDSQDSVFLSENGNRLVDDSVSRELFFVGIDTYNPIRDRLLRNTPSIFNVENTVLKNVISTQAKELYTAQKKVGEALSNNYISIPVADEVRTRSSGAFDRFYNEGVYQVDRVSLTPTNSFKKLDVITFSASESTETVPYYKISLQQELASETIDSDSETASFSGFLVSVSNKQVIKVLSAKLIKQTDEEDCNGVIGTEYGLNAFKYSILDASYDPDNARRYTALSKNQILFSQFGNWERPAVGDSIEISYLYKDVSKSIDLDSLSVYRIEQIADEIIPANASSFYLKNAPIVNSSNEVYTSAGVSFRESENSDEVPAQFNKEIVFNSARLPSMPGEYSIDYSTGLVIVYGENNLNPGTGQTNFISSYSYRKSFYQDIDYSISDYDWCAIKGRSLVNSTANISFNYNRELVRDEDYKFASHIEELSEHVGANLSSSFSLRTKNAPIMDVYKIYNSTTGELYNKVYATETEVQFSGNRSPEIKEVKGELANFTKTSEQLEVIGEFISPTFAVKITSAASTNSIIFTPPIPAELIDITSSEYFYKPQDRSSAELTQIQAFGTPNGNNLISSLEINSSTTLPVVGQKFYIGLRTFIISLKNKGVLNKSLDSLGFYLNSSFEPDRSDLFVDEKFFKQVTINPNLVSTDETFFFNFDITSSDTIYENFTRLRNVGDFAVDYQYGIVYLSVSSNEILDVGDATYYHSTISSLNNVLSASHAEKKATPVSEPVIIYDRLSNTEETVSILELDSSFSYNDGSVVSGKYNNEETICVVNSDYEVFLPYNISSVSGIWKDEDIFAQNLNASEQVDRIKEKSKAYLLANNIYTSKISFTDNVIDLKTKVDKRAYGVTDKTVTILDTEADSIWGIRKKGQDVWLCDESLVFDVFSSVKIVNVDEQSGYSVLSVVSSDISDFEIGQYIKDSNGSLFEITAIDTVLSKVTVDSPAFNDSGDDYPELDFAGESSVAVYATVTDVAEGLEISIPEAVPLINGELLEIYYLTANIPVENTNLYIDCRFGSIYVDYTYVYDQLYVWYEWGDDSIDWSISNTLSEGETYYVSYKYGADRTALLRNFGLITGIPYFQNFSLDTNRELYRSALIGTLQSFSKGPTLESYEELVRSFTDVTPEITESFHTSWVLGRDYLHLNKPKVSGELEFKSGKFEDGLNFREGNCLILPAESSISLKEGTIESWVRPSWAGVDNDATLKFDIKHIGTEKFQLSNSKSLDSWDHVSSAGTLYNYESATNISNYSTEQDNIVLGENGLKFNLESLSFITDTALHLKIKIPFIGFHFNYLYPEIQATLSDSHKVFSFGFWDNKKYTSFSYALDLCYDESGAAVFNGAESDTANTEELPEFVRPHRTKNCNCVITNNIGTLENFNDLLIRIDLDFSFETFRSTYNIIDNKASSIVVVDADQNIFQVVSFEYLGDKFTDIPDNIDAIFVSKFPINYPKLRNMSGTEINSFQPTTDLRIYAKTLRFDSDLQKSSIALSTKHLVIDHSEEHIVKLSRRPKLNTVDLTVSNVYESFYTDYSASGLDSSTAPHFFIHSKDSDLASEAIVYQLQGFLYNRFSVSDIYIGKTGYSPKRSTFEVSRYDYPNQSVGMPINADISEGLFIGFDELCTSPLSDNVGQWVFRTRANRAVWFPVDVVISDSTYENVFEPLQIEHKFSGTITTNGEFSSVVKSKRTDGVCDNSNDCIASYKYCGNELLQDVGWTKIEESESDLINVSIGGRETSSVAWVAVGNTASNSENGIFTIGPSAADDFECEEDGYIGNLFYTQVPCKGGDFSYVISMRVNSYNEAPGLNEFEFIGIVPLIIEDQNFAIKIALGFQSNNPIIAVIDGTTNNTIDFGSSGWTDNAFHAYTLTYEKEAQKVTLSVDDVIVSEVSSLNFYYTDNSSIGFYLNDVSLTSDEQNNTASIDLITFNSSVVYSDGYIEDNDVILNTDSKIEFEFNIDDFDGYQESYSDAYGYNSSGYDGYSFDITQGVDEILINSDKLHYMFDSGETESKNRLSIFKDGKGFLNFRVWDNQKLNFYNLATNIKHWLQDELHHVAVSWRFNSIEHEDEMHMFIDGQEVPNIYKFGGSVPVKVNSKFSDVSQESLQSFLSKEIHYCEEYAGQTTAASSLFSSSDITFTSEHIGRVILIKESSLAPTLIGKEYVIISVSGGSARFGRGDSLELITFDVSASDIVFSFAPWAEGCLTDFRNSRFLVFREDATGNKTELSGIVYEIIDGEISVISGSNATIPKWRANASTRLIEFAGTNEDCIFTQSVEKDDVDVHIETFGLALENINYKVYHSGHSYHSEPSKFSGESVIPLLVRPASLSDITIRKTLLDRTLITYSSITSHAEGFIANFDIALDSKVSSDQNVVYNQNLGRALSIVFDSDNVNFCNYDGYEDAYQDGYLDSFLNSITVYGTTTDGVNEETAFIYKNGEVSLQKFFTSVSEIRGKLFILDAEEEVGVIELKERDHLGISNNGGSALEVWSYENNNLLLKTFGSSGNYPFVINPGIYAYTYISHLSIKLNSLGKQICIGADMHSYNSFGGVLDEFRILTEMSSDTRPGEDFSSGTRSVTEDYNTQSEFCSDSNTLVLLHLNNPSSSQIERLKQLEFLNTIDNYKYSLSSDQIDSLILSIGSEQDFVSKMLNYGFSLDEARRAYVEVFNYDGSPIENSAVYFKKFITYKSSESSVNDSFNYSAMFDDGARVLLSNRENILRDKGTIEFWVSPLRDTKYDEENRYYFDASTAAQQFAKSDSSNIIKLQIPASEVLSVQLIDKTKEFSEYTGSQILYDSLERSRTSGMLSGGTGSKKNWLTGSRLSADGLTLFLSEPLPREKVDILTTYIPLGVQNQRLSILKNQYNQLQFNLTAGGVDNIISTDIDWAKNSWHRVQVLFQANTSSDYIRILVDGQDTSIIKYGTGLVYGTGYVYGQYIYDDGITPNTTYKIPLTSDFRYISIGSDIYGYNSAKARMDNLRISLEPRQNPKGSNGRIADLNYSDNLDSISPVKEDNITTKLIDFDQTEEEVSQFASIVDAERGIYNFDISVSDPFNKIEEDTTKELIKILVNKLKPAHTRATVRFSKPKC